MILTDRSTGVHKELAVALGAGDAANRSSRRTSQPRATSAAATSSRTRYERRVA